MLEETLGTIVYQEQVIEVAMALAGFSSSEAEGLRRAMSRKRSEEAIGEHHHRFLAGAAANGVSEEVAERVWEQIQGFSGFGFPKAHSAAFGLLAYQSAWLRVHYGPEFLCALLNEQPMGFYPPDSLVHEAQRRGIRVVAARRQPQPRPLPRRIAAGGRRRARRAGGADRARLREGGARRRRWRRWSSSASAAGPTEGIAELASRSGAGLPSLERLAWAGALDGIPVGAEDGDRREALWRVGVTGAGRGAATAPSWRCRWSRPSRRGWSRSASGGS